jgi:hypothetical protein
MVAGGFLWAFLLTGLGLFLRRRFKKAAATSAP